jgi:hypothetical protein
LASILQVTISGQEGVSRRRAGRGDEEPCRYITDNGDLLPVKHKISHPVTDLPESMVMMRSGPS